MAAEVRRAFQARGLSLRNKPNEPNISPVMDSYNEFLKELRKKRQAKGLTQAEVAKGIKLSRAQYTAIEKGRCLVNWRHLHNLAVFLKTRWVIQA